MINLCSKTNPELVTLFSTETTFKRLKSILDQEKRMVITASSLHSSRMDL